ncbi:MAG: bifunctional homocysteine S-methyltransferase/methylenetetrahydrofolate reductase [Candidatus Eiseniibacteriota bacterium]
MESPFLTRLARGPVVADGAMGTLLYARGISFEQSFDELNRTAPAVVGGVHRDYLAAGAELLETNTFGANRIRLSQFGLEDHVRVIARQGVRVARDAREVMGVPAFVAGSMGPLGKPVAPYGTIAVDDAEGWFREAAEGLLEGGVDAFILETFGDLTEILAAMRAVRSVCHLPVLAMMTFGEDGKTFYGHQPADVYRRLAEAGADVIGVNCSVGPQGALDVLRAMRTAPSGGSPGAKDGVLSGPPLAAMPNAGLPQLVGGRYLYMATPEYFGTYAKRFVEAGAVIVGGCCGTTPEHVRRIRASLADPTTAEVATGESPTAPHRTPIVPSGPPASASSGAAGALAEPAAGERETPRILSLLKEKFLISVELDPPRGINPQKILAGAALLAERGVDAVNVADSPMARVRMSAQALTYVVMRHFPRFETILHFTCRDRNLMGIQADLLGAHAMGLRTILALTGDPPSAGDYPNVTAVYDVDSIGLIRVIRKLNEGTDLAGNPIGERTNFAIACAVNPTAEDLELEIHRFKKKLEAGADFVMTQPFYEIGIWDRFLAECGPIPVPILLGILPLQSYRHAEFMHNEVPGIVVPQALRDRLRDAGAGAQAEGVRHARELFQAARGRFAGVYLMPSFGRYENVLEVIAGETVGPATAPRR